MTQRNTVIGSHYFERRDIRIGPDEIVLVACMRNEALRLPYFLDYYRRLGVTRFLLVDNASTDETREILQGQPDVEYFHTDASFKGSAAGRLWNHELAQTYAMGRWVLTPDVDELFVYPGAERFGLRDLCDYLDAQGYDGVYAPMIDMYADVPLSQAHYRQGEDFLDTCPYFDTDTYHLQPMADPPFVGVFGGPRGAMFAASGQGQGPLYTKVPLVRWQPGFSYIRVAHTHRALQLADVTGAMLHFKFFSAWADVVFREIERGDRRSANAWSVYADHSTDDLCFYGPQSRRFTAPRDLVVLGVMAAPDPLRKHLRQRLAGLDEDAGLVDDLLPQPAGAEGGFTLRAFASLWRFVQNPAIMRHFGRDEPRDHDYRAHLVRELCRHFEVLDVHADHLLVRIDEPALHRWRRSGLALSAYVGGRPVGTVMADGSDDGLLIDTEAVEANVCRWPLEIGAAAEKEPGDGPVPISVYLRDAGDPAAPASPPATWPEPQDAEIFTGEWHRSPVTAAPELGVDGVVHGFENGEVVGWCYDADRATFDRPVALYVNGRLVAHARPRVVRPPLAERVGASSSVVGRGFRVPLPLGYFRDNGVSDVRIEVRVAGTNIALRRMPIELPSSARSASWTKRCGWVPAD